MAKGLPRSHDRGVFAGNEFSTSEMQTPAKWLDGSPIFRKVIDFGALPNATNKTLAHGLTGTYTVVGLTGIATNLGGTGAMTLPNTGSNACSLTMDATVVSVNASVDLSAFVGYVVIDYIKA